MKRATVLLMRQLVLLGPVAFVLGVASCGDGAQPTHTLLPTPSATSHPGPLATASSTSVPTAGTAIAFQSLAQGFRLAGPSSEPALLAATDATSLEALASLVDNEHRALLNTVDLESEAVLAAFSGVEPYGGFSVTVTGLVLSDSELTVTVDVRENAPGFPTVDATTLPYHLITIRRETLTELTGLRYRLVRGDTVLAVGALP